MLRWMIAIALVALAGTRAFAQESGRGLSCKALAGEFVQLAIKGHKRFQVYRTGPSAAEIGILLLPGRSGLNEPMLAWADRLGAEGYRVVAVDLYGKARVPKSRTAPLNSQRLADAEERSAIHFLSAPGRKIVTLGWGSMGAMQSLEASATDSADVSGTVLVDGGASAPASLVQRLKSLVLLVAFNSTTPLPKLQAFEERMRLYGKPLTVHYYNVSPKTVDPTGPDYSSTIAQEIWAQVDTFLGRAQFLCRRCAPYQNYLFDYHN